MRRLLFGSTIEIECKLHITFKKGLEMIYSHKKDTCKRNLSREEKTKLKKLLKTRPTSWMIDKTLKLN
jgi:hypothetical protein